MCAECRAVTTPAWIRQFLLFLTFTDGQVSIVCHRRLRTVNSVSLVRGYSRSLPIHPLIPGDELQHQLPTEPHIAPSSSSSSSSRASLLH